MKKSLLLLSGLVAANVAPIELAASEASRPAFAVRSEMFEALPGDRVVTESTEKGKGIRWDIRYPEKQNRALVKSVSTGLLKGTRGMSFWVRASTVHQLCVQVDEAGGDRFFTIINIDSHWNHVALPYADLKPIGELDGTRRPEPARINKVLLLDFSASTKQPRKGKSVWLADWKFATDPPSPVA